MTFSRTFLFAAATVLLTGSALAQVDLSQCLDDTFEGDKDTDIHEVQFKRKYAINFNIKYMGTRKELITEPRGFDIKRKMLLYQCGLEPTKGEEKKYKEKDRIPIPLQNVVLYGVAPITYLEHFDLLDRVSAYIGDISFITSPCLLDLVDNYNIETYASFDDYNANPERHSEGEVVLESTWGERLYSEHSKVIKFVPWNEHHPYATQEYHGLIAALFNVDERAQEEEKLLQSATKCTKKYLKSRKTKTIAWAYVSYTSTWGAQYSEKWYPPSPGACDGEDDEVPYYCTLAKNCGGEILTADTYDGMDNTQFIEYAKDADILIYTSNSWEYDQDKNRILGANDVFSVDPGEPIPEGRKYMNAGKFKFMKKHHVYDIQMSGMNYWFESKDGQMEQLGADICAVISDNKQYKGSDFIGHKRKFLRNVFYPDEIPQAPNTCGETDPVFECRDAADSFQFKAKTAPKDYTTCTELAAMSEADIKKNCKSSRLVKAPGALTVQRRVATLCKVTCSLCDSNVCFEYDKNAP